MNVCILDDFADALRTLPCFAKLDPHEVTVFTDHVDDLDEQVRRLRECEALILVGRRTEIQAALLERLPKLQLISQRSSYTHIDLEACTRLGVTVSSMLEIKGNVAAAAELTWALVLASMRQIPQQMTSLRAGSWQTAVGSTLVGKTLGIFGYGRIGRIVAGYGAAFGMSVRIWGSERSRKQASSDGYAAAGSKRAFFQTCDVISLQLRLVDATRGIVTADDLRAMKPTALLVNTSRAALIQPGALVTALEAGRPRLAAIDVFDHEPADPQQDPLVRNDNVVCTPHIGYVTREEWELQFADVFDQVNAYAHGAPINVVNPMVLHAPTDRFRPRTTG